MSKRKINKIAKKHCDKKCKFCSCDKYELLDVHRIIEGKDGGEYTEFNTVTVCSLCHRKIHAGLIKIIRKYYSTKGWVLHYFDENKIEHFN
jgi:hypothetical protein